MTGLKLLIGYAVQVYNLILIVYALMSWFPNARESQLGRWVSRLAEPYLEIFDRILPSVGGISFSVIAGIFVLQLAQRGLMVLLP